jgi:micrococcal nuclease
MKRRETNSKTLIIVFLITIILLSSFFLFVFPNLNKTSIPNTSHPENYVTRVIDGDTFVINSGEIIRLLCVNTPEKNQTGYEEATSYLESLILYKEVTLQPSITDKDKYGRLLRFVYVDNSFINKMILDNHYGELMVIPPENCTEMN